MRTVYAVRDVSGALIAAHVRLDHPAGKRLYWQRPGHDPRDGLGGLSTADLPLYGSERLRDLPVGRSVVVTEGERACEALWWIGCDALATVTGASGTPGEDALAPLLPYDVVLWPDRDEVGEEHMARVAARLLRLGGAARRLNWAGAREKGDDAADFLARGGKRLVVDLMIAAATPWTVATPAPRHRRVREGDLRADRTGRTNRARSRLADVVEAALGPPARRVGRSLFWCCPFHKDDTPSFKVDVNEPFFRCFGCDKKGDVFTFLRLSDGRTFGETLRELAPANLGAIPRLWG